MKKHFILVGFLSFMPIMAFASENHNNTTTVAQTPVPANNTFIDNVGNAVLLGHAESAAEVRSNSNPEVSPCGDSSGVSGQTGILGGGLATITETCRAYRLEVLTKVSPDAMSTKLARITHFVGWFPRMLLHVASFGVLN